jgi:hypothetical protein
MTDPIRGQNFTYSIANNAKREAVQAARRLSASAIR